MATPNYGAAAKRHFEDGKCLFDRGGRHLPGADQLFGLAVECALKRNLAKTNLLTITQDGRPHQENLKGGSGHCPGIWAEYLIYLGEARNLPPISKDNPFNDWDISDRYADGRAMDFGRVERHLIAAKAVLSATMDI